MRARSGRVTQRCHNSPDGKRGYIVRMTSRTGSVRRILRILKKSVSWVESCLGRRQLTFACSRRPLASVARDGGGGKWKSQNRKNVYLSPYVEAPLNSKVIKSFVPELRSRKCFSCFEIPMFDVYIYIWTFYIHFAYPYLAMVHYLTNSWRDKVFHSFPRAKSECNSMTGVWKLATMSKSNTLPSMPRGLPLFW